jgi:hypothetical protein
MGYVASRNIDRGMDQVEKEMSKAGAEIAEAMRISQDDIRERFNEIEEAMSQAKPDVPEHPEPIEVSDQDDVLTSHDEDELVEKTEDEDEVVTKDDDDGDGDGDGDNQKFGQWDSLIRSVLMGFGTYAAKKDSGGLSFLESPSGVLGGGSSRPGLVQRCQLPIARALETGDISALPPECYEPYLEVERQIKQGGISGRPNESDTQVAPTARLRRSKRRRRRSVPPA